VPESVSASAAPAANPGAAAPLTPVANRGLITVCAMVATLMQALDSTIANVALPYMQGSLAATSDQITWVLTSYIVAAAIMTAPVGWLSVRFGRKTLFITCLVGFTVTSMLCGAAQSLTQMVLFRLLQGVFGAALVPLSQATMLDIYPPAQRGSAMAMWGMGVMVGPILGPTLGGYLTELYNWRWVFYVNLPFGALATLGIAAFLPKGRVRSELRFDWIGFGVLALGVGSLQLMLDRGETKDWFGSSEIIVEAVLAGVGLYLFVVHLLLAEKPFISPAIFKDRNFSASLLVMFSVGMVLLATSALLAPWLQNLANYPVATAGLVMAPRGIGTMAAMLISGRLSNRVDPRVLMALGILLISYTLWEQTGWTPAVSQWTLIVNTVVQGAGLGFVFIPLQVIAFTTLPDRFRPDGTALLSLFRNIGSAIGVSLTSALLARNIQVAHATLAERVTPFNRALQDGGLTQQMLNPVPGGAPVVPGGIANLQMLQPGSANATLLDSLVNQQAVIIAYLDDFKFLLLTTLPTLLLLLLMRRPKAVAVEPGHAAME
jgi:MFS transporter, DHA2 family, multidrug resistance protein